MIWKEPSMEAWTKEMEKTKTALLYFGNETCSVCKADWPRIASFGEEVLVGKVDTRKNPRFAAQYLVFSQPTVLIFHWGKEIFRQSHFLSFPQIDERMKTSEEEP